MFFFLNWAGPAPVRHLVAIRVIRSIVCPQTDLVRSPGHLHPPGHGEMHSDCSRWRCKTHNAACSPTKSSNRFAVLCGCPPGRPVYDRFYDVCHQGRFPNERCLSSEACAIMDANSHCANGTCQCLEGLQSLGLGPCRAWASYAEPCNGLVDCVGEGVVCGPSACVCARGRVRVNDTCIVRPEEGLGDLNTRQTIALVSSLLITTTGVLLVLGSLCKPICQRCSDRADGRRSGKGVAAVSYKLPQWADADSYYMSTRFWVSEQPYYSVTPKELHPKVYFAW
ncbi:hypothetical protein HPB48_023833 [Haemaphysalis longicornis]|uniref:EB domain-containing protein n=1 Tax=Haemaphysalis longicornis TaxID=44386 RepID=A0A9J6H7S9_HAELO|nr:hypothetical protein HPB48_023833 [Haemaphysalis longicornis]